MGTLTCEPCAELQLAQRARELGQQLAERDADDHASENPERQVALEEVEPFGLWQGAMATGRNVISGAHSSSSFSRSIRPGRSRSCRARRALRISRWIQNAEAAQDDAANRLAGLGMLCERRVVHALLDLVVARLLAGLRGMVS